MKVTIVSYSCRDAFLQQGEGEGEDEGACGWAAWALLKRE